MRKRPEFPGEIRAVFVVFICEICRKKAKKDGKKSYPYKTGVYPYISQEYHETTEENRWQFCRPFLTQNEEKQPFSRSKMAERRVHRRKEYRKTTEILGTSERAKTAKNTMKLRKKRGIP